MARRTNVLLGLMSSRCCTALAAIAGMAILVAVPSPAQGQPSQIESLSVVSESADAVTLQVVYFYNGDQGSDVFMSAKMVQNGAQSAYYGYRPGAVRRGRNRTRVELNATERAPDLFSTNQIEVGMYVGGGSVFLNRAFTFAKTWSRLGANLPAVARGAGLPHLAGNMAIQAVRPIGQTANPFGAPPDSGGAPVRRVLDDGSIELRYPDGTIRIRTTGGETVIHPDGTRQVFQFQNAQPPTPPSVPPNAAHAAWVSAELDSLLNVIRTLVGNDQPSIDHFLAQEGAGLSPYRRINQRTRAIDMLVRP